MRNGALRVDALVLGWVEENGRILRSICSSAAGLAALVGLAVPVSATAYNPPGRAYEMVSPVDKNGGDISRDYLVISGGRSDAGAAPSGDVVAYTSRLQFGEIESASISPTYVANRKSAGWATEGVTPPIGNVEFLSGAERPNVMGFSRDLSRAFVTTPVDLTPDAGALNGSWGLYMRTSGQDPRYGLLSHPWAPLVPDTEVTFAAARFEFEAATPDSSHVVFNTNRQLLPDGPPDDANNTPNAVYEWVNGTLRLVSVLPDGLPTGTTIAPLSVVAGGGEQRLQNGDLHGDHVISDDGRRVFFTASLYNAAQTRITRHLMVREDGVVTRMLSASDRAADSADPLLTEGTFWGARAADGGVAFFSGGFFPLTEGGSSLSLYRWRADAPEGQNLTELSLDPLGEPGLMGPSAMSDDATSLYFVATGVLADGATRGEPNLYNWRQGEGVRYIATLDAARDSRMWELERTNGGRGARVSADGDRLLFASYAKLDPSFDNTEATPEACGDPATGGDPCRQLYVYDASSDRLSCVTCIVTAPLTGNVHLYGNDDERRDLVDDNQSMPTSMPRNLTADGKRAFFETARTLLPQDDNGVSDVYAWEDADLNGVGELRLISPGTTGNPALFLDASRSGDDVFFTTRDRLVGIDGDNQIDLYDARVGGGFAAQNPVASLPCRDDGCQGAASPRPSLPGIGSGLNGRGNANPGTRPAFAVHRLSQALRAQLARGQRVIVRVRVNRGGRVALTARARIGARVKTVASVSKRARGAGTVKLPLKLSAAARRELSRDSTLTVRLDVRFSGVREASSSTVKLTRAPRSGERGAR